MKKTVAIVAGALVGLLPLTGASAHVTVQPNEVVAGGFQTFWVQVPNERDDASTIKVEVEFPQAFAFVSFEDVEGWERKVEMVEFDEPIEAFGEEVTEGVGTVTWSGGEVEPGEFVRFPFSAGVTPPGVLEFKALQTYSSGEVVRWIGPPDSEEPAGRVTGVDLGLEEGQGQLAALADVKAQMEELGAEDAEPDKDMTALYVGGAGVLIGLIALVLALNKRKAA